MKNPHPSVMKTSRGPDRNQRKQVRKFPGNSDIADSGTHLVRTVCLTLEFLLFFPTPGKGQEGTYPLERESPQQDFRPALCGLLSLSSLPQFCSRIVQVGLSRTQVVDGHQIHVDSGLLALMSNPDVEIQSSVLLPDTSFPSTPLFF